MRNFGGLVYRTKSVRILLFAGAFVGCESTPPDREDRGRWGRTEVVEDMRIGVLEGPEEYIFGRIGHVAVGRNKAVYVADIQLNTVRQYDEGGRFVRHIGGQGQGPGEYARVLGMKVLPDGTIALLDVPHRVILYDADGSYRTDFRVPSALHTDRMMEIDRSGKIYVKATEGEIRPGVNDEPPPLALVQMSANGEVLGRIPLPPEDPSEKSFLLMTPEGALRNFVFSTRSAWSPLAHLVVGRNDAYSIEIVAHGAVSVRIERSVDPAAVVSGERDEWEAWADYMERRTREGGHSVSYPAIPQFKPFFKDIYVGDDGRIWVHRHVEATERDVPARQPGDERPLLSWREPPTFDVFETDGEFLGTVAVPQDMSIRVMHAAHVWGVQATDAGEQLVRLRIETASH